MQYLTRRELGEVLESTDLEEDGDVQQQEQQRRSLVGSSKDNENDSSKNSNENDGKRTKTMYKENVNDNDCDHQHQGDTVERSTAAATSRSIPHDWAKIVWSVTSQTTPAKAPHERLIMGTVILWTVVLTVIGFYQHYATNDNNNDSPGEEVTNSFAQNVVGYVVNLNLVFYYGAPLSSIFQVLRTKRSNTLHGPTMVMNTSNAVFWTAYAVAPQIRDPFIYVPNGLGVVLGATQLALWAIFPKTKGSISSSANGKEHTTITTTAILGGEENALEIAV